MCSEGALRWGEWRLGEATEQTTVAEEGRRGGGLSTQQAAAWKKRRLLAPEAFGSGEVERADAGQWAAGGGRPDGEIAVLVNAGASVFHGRPLGGGFVCSAWYVSERPMAEDA